MNAQEIIGTALVPGERFNAQSPVVSILVDCLADIDLIALMGYEEKSDILQAGPNTPFQSVRQLHSHEIQIDLNKFL